MAWQTVGHGADAFAFWQWRSALNGQEQYHGTLVGPDGEPVPLFDEVRANGEGIRRGREGAGGNAPGFGGGDPALLRQPLGNRFPPAIERYDQIRVLLDYYEPLRRATQSVDIVPPDAPLDGYKLVFAPSLNVITENTAEHLLQYVQQGGHLVLGPRSGMKDAYNALWTNRQPGPLAAELGGRVEQVLRAAGRGPGAGRVGQRKGEHLGRRRFPRTGPRC